MKLSIENKGNYQYAKIPGKSVRNGKKVRKTDVVYLGRVIDLEKGIFFTRERGVYKYDVNTGEYGKADPEYIGSLTNDRRKKEKLILDFGDVYLVDAFIKNIGYDKVLETIGYRNQDTLKAMAAYYIVSERANMYAKTWQEGSVASILYPKADLISPRISDFLEALGRDDIRRAYFQAHIKWIKENICNDPAVLIDSTGLPNDIRINLTQISNHNGDINNEARMITAVQRDSGFPLMFRAVPGNVVDVSTLSRTITLLSEYGMPTDLSLLDAGYFSDHNADLLYKAKIDFVTRLPERNRTLYHAILRKAQPELRRKENLVKYRDRYVYIKRVECRIGADKNLAYAYVGYDVDGSGDTNHKVINSSRKKAKSIEAMHDAFEVSGIFILLSSLAFDTDEILEVYYLRQQVEQYFDVSKGISRLTPLRVHTEQRVLGHLLLCQVAATINLAIQKRMNQYFENREGMFMSLRNQKCEVFAERIVTYEGQSDANQFYKKLRIDYPLSFKRQKESWVPCDMIPSASEAKSS
jgi:hypothetical protein